MVKGLGRLIRHLNDSTMQYSIVSNSIFNQAKLKEMVDAGLRAYVASIDVIDSGDNTLADLRKSSAGLAMLERLKAHGVSYLCGNIVISGKNINVVMEVTRYLNDRGIWVNICPVVWGRGDKWDLITEDDLQYRLDENHRDKLADISRQLLAMKRAGARIIPSETYIAAMASHGIDLDWHCCREGGNNDPPRLIVDADGGLMTCINDRGDVAERYSIFDLRQPGLYWRFMADWQEDARRCEGCYWSTMVMARERQELLADYKRATLSGGLPA
jgi:hypothetical protein